MLHKKISSQATVGDINSSLKIILDLNPQYVAIFDSKLKCFVIQKEPAIKAEATATSTKINNK